MPSQVIGQQRKADRSKDNRPARDVANASKQPGLCQPSEIKQQSSRERIPGTHLATYSEGTGAGASLLTLARVKNRRSSAISLRDAQNIIAAARFAEHVGLPLVRFTTVHFEAAGITDPVKAIGRLLKLMGDWLRTNGGAFAYVGTRETGGSKGEHIHLLLHVPAALRAGFNRRQGGWLRAIGARKARGVIVSKPVGRVYLAGRSDPGARGHYADNLSATLAYLLKGAEPNAHERLALPRAQSGGHLLGKRCFHSENIGRAARARNATAPDPEAHSDTRCIVGRPSNPRTSAMQLSSAKGGKQTIAEGSDDPIN